MGYREVLLLATGVFIYLLLRSGVRWLSAKTDFKETAATRSFILFIGNLVLVAGGLAIALFSIKFTVEPNSMTTANIEQLNEWIGMYFDLVWVLTGILLGAFLLFVWQTILSARQRSAARRQDEIRTIAYGLWENEGRPNGRDIEHWHKAEGIWKQRHNRR